MGNSIEVGEGNAMVFDDKMRELSGVTHIYTAGNGSRVDYYLLYADYDRTVKWISEPYSDLAPNPNSNKSPSRLLKVVGKNGFIATDPNNPEKEILKYETIT